MLWHYQKSQYHSRQLGNCSVQPLQIYNISWNKLHLGIKAIEHADLCGVVAAFRFKNFALYSYASHPLHSILLEWFSTLQQTLTTFSFQYSKLCLKCVVSNQSLSGFWITSFAPEIWKWKEWLWGWQNKPSSGVIIYATTCSSAEEQRSSKPRAQQNPHSHYEVNF